jgi:hypothetical protein
MLNVSIDYNPNCYHQDLRVINQKFNQEESNNKLRHMERSLAWSYHLIKDVIYLEYAPNAYDESLTNNHQKIKLYRTIK